MLRYILKVCNHLIYIFTILILNLSIVYHILFIILMIMEEVFFNMLQDLRYCTLYLEVYVNPYHIANHKWRNFLLIINFVWISNQFLLVHKLCLIFLVIIKMKYISSMGLHCRVLRNKLNSKNKDFN
jgi:hypothetical protein